jgi:hypothetical protein
MAVQIVEIKDWATAKPILMAAVAAGVSAVWNSLIQVKNKTF